MKTRISIWASILFVITMASCAPPAVMYQGAATEPVLPTPTFVVTPRGPNLEAIDPSTVHLASGNLQLVEFFRFT